MRKRPASLTFSSFIKPVSSHTKRITIPYILAGTGNGKIYLSNSPIKEITKIIINCLKNFIYTFLPNLHTTFFVKK